MLDVKYGLKYSMPHSVVHIIDNSANRDFNNVTVADDPSLYASIVVTGAPMGADNKIITINRSDVLNVAYGLNSLSASDINIYGQAVTYAPSLISQNVPVKFMRVTPEDSTYGFSCLLIQWKWDVVSNTMHVRFKTTSEMGNNGLPAGEIHSRFKNPQRLHAKLVKAFSVDSQDDGDGTGSWTQRVFMTHIAAGRGKEYNYYVNAINQTIQSKRPPNVRYSFSTIDTRIDQVVETFQASLVNQNNGLRPDYIETVNNQVNRRVEGSSIIIPTINESAVNELYNEYMRRYKDIMDDPSISTTYENDKFIRNVYATMTINIFDPIYGRYIYNGDTDVKLPFYQVDMFDLDIPKLTSANRLAVISDNFDINKPDVIYNHLNSNVYTGISKQGDNVHIGDIYCNASTNYPSLSLVTGINQYTGSVTSIPMGYIYTDLTDKKTEKTASFRLTIFCDVNDETKLHSEIEDLIKAKKLVPRGNSSVNKDYIIVVNNNKDYSNTFDVVEIVYTEKTDESTKNKTYVFDPIMNKPKVLSKEEVYKRIVYPNTPVSSFATSETDNSWDKPGSTIIDINNVFGSTDKSVEVYVNKNYINPDNKSDINDRYKVASTSFKIGSCPTNVSIIQNYLNEQFDVMIYKAKDISTYTVSNVKIANGGSGYAVGDFVNIVDGSSSDIGIKLRIDEIDSTGSVENVSIISSILTKSINSATYNTVIDSVENTSAVGLTIKIDSNDVRPNVPDKKDPTYIQRYQIPGTQGSIYRIEKDSTPIPANYYSNSYGINPNSELGGIPIENGYAGFFDDDSINEIEFKWRYSDLLVRAFRGEIDPRIKSPSRISAKYMFDGGYNTLIGQTILPYMTYTPIDIINSSTIFSADEKELINLDTSLISGIKEFADIDVKQAMYDLMDFRIYQGIPEDKRPIGPGSGLSLHLDSGVTDANTAILINQSFIKRFTNPNASWDIGGYVSAKDGVSYTYTKRIVDNLFSHIKRFSINKPFTGQYTSITPDEYISFFPDIDMTDWEMRELLYNSGGNAWILDINGNIQRKSQRTLHKENELSDLIQENNMRTLSQLVYLLQNKIDSYLLEYNDDGVLKTLKDECDNMFSNWIGNLVEDLDITFERDTDPLNGGDIVVCYCNVTFRGLILRVPIIVNVQRRNQ